MAKYYAGIGSRKTPEMVLASMAYHARYLSDIWTLRSGGAKGADSIFEASAILHEGKTEIFKGEDATEDARQITAQYHPAWEKCTPYVRNLHARNVQILLGRNLDTPVEFVICYTKDGKDIGGTGQSIRIAKDRGIPVFNLYRHLDQLNLQTFVQQ
jgi:hypothetical protein